ncbi:hypothetical protein [Pedobacter sp. GR22-10]|uniref:hypothetical protein n=1 Tax=Pedobacter TaxID=84567 RepID=UPI0022485655|nr:hypothetical protein [Pedobacter sp. GR22-10]MCX2431477.1 hypothetical protein [Pedobacter sp. GR22-10]
MRFLKLTVALSLFFMFTNSFGQNAVIDFTGTPQMYSGDGVYNPNYWANGGCPTYHQFGPNPLPVNGYNVRTSGRVLIAPTYTNTSTTYSMSIYAFGNMSTGQRENNAISVEYPFQANKSYLIEIVGVNDHNWDGNGTAGTRYNGVFWVKLDDNANLPTTSQSPCVAVYTPVEKSVGRYSKLIADPDFSILARNHQVKFSMKESKSALKITFDASPYVPGIKIDNIFRLGKIKITEIPYEEDQLSTYRYLNTPRETLGHNERNNPEYNISYTPPIKPITPRPERGISSEVSINADQWILNPDGNSYSFNFGSTINDLEIFELLSLTLITDENNDTAGTRPDRPSLKRIQLPCTYQDHDYSYDLFNRDIFITVHNSNNTVPTKPVAFTFTYK